MRSVQSGLSLKVELDVSDLIEECLAMREAYGLTYVAWSSCTDRSWRVQEDARVGHRLQEPPQACITRARLSGARVSRIPPVFVGALSFDMADLARYQVNKRLVDIKFDAMLKAPNVGSNASYNLVFSRDGHSTKPRRQEAS